MPTRSNAPPAPDEVFLSTPCIRGGVACFAGTRVGVSHQHDINALSSIVAGTRVGVSQLLGYLRNGHTVDDFLSDFPTVSKEQAQFAIERIDNEYMRAIEQACVNRTSA